MKFNASYAVQTSQTQMGVSFCHMQEPPAERHCCVTEGTNHNTRSPDRATVGAT
jgi:hypothetical protein